MMRTIGNKIVAVLIPSGVTAALMLGSIGTANAIGNDRETTRANIMAPCYSIQGQQCIGPSTRDDNSTNKFDEPLSHILNQVPVLSSMI